MREISKQFSGKRKGRPRKKIAGLSSVKTLARPDQWAGNMGLRVDGRDFDLRGREYVRDVIRDYSPEIVIPKAAQMAFTITMIVKSLHNVIERKWNGLYLLPVKEGARTFVQARIDTIIESNDSLSAQFQNVDNRLHKQTPGGVNFYIRGTNLNRELQEVPVDFQIWDERDRMVEKNLADARHRMDGSRVKKLIQLSTPTVPGHGIDSEEAWHRSDMHRWEIPCPGCGRFQVITFEENVRLGEDEFDCVVECVFCHRAFGDEERASQNEFGRWVSHNLDGRLRGYHISQFNSPTQSLTEILSSWFKGQTEQEEMAAFYRQNLGVPFVAKGDKITIELLDQCRQRGLVLGGIPDGPVFVGCDIGTFIHLTALALDRWGRQRLWQMKICKEWSEVDDFLSRLTNFSCVIDAQPEKRSARDLALKYHGKVWIGYENDRDYQNEIAVFMPLKVREAGKVNIERTMAFDQVVADFIDGRVLLPANIRELGEELPNRDFNGFYSHMIQQVRVEEPNAKGQVVARWRRNKNPDHWHHSFMFARIAMYKAPRLNVPPGISAAINKAGTLVR